jgi:hypothetical protein
MSSGALLLAAAFTQKKLRAAVGSSVDDAVAEMGRRSDVRKAAGLVALLALSQRLSTRARGALLEGRQNARLAGARRLSVELGAVGVVLVLARHDAFSRHDEDDAYATTAADALSVAWRGLAFAALSSAIRNDTDPAKALAKTGRPLLPSIDRTASTETARAFNDEHRRALKEATERDERIAVQLRLTRVLREWNAMLDACGRCRPHDGERVAYDDVFSGGDEPGGMHPRCMCTETLVTETGALSEAA